MDLNLRPIPYRGIALPTELTEHSLPRPATSELDLPILHSLNSTRQTADRHNKTFLACLANQGSALTEHGKAHWSQLSSACPAMPDHTRTSRNENGPDKLYHARLNGTCCAYYGLADPALPDYASPCSAKTIYATNSFPALPGLTPICRD